MVLRLERLLGFQDQTASCLLTKPCEGELVWFEGGNLQDGHEVTAYAQGICETKFMNTATGMERGTSRRVHEQGKMY